MIVDKNLPNGFSPNRTKNLLEQRDEQQTYIWKAGTRVGSEICEMAITEFRECTRIDLLIQSAGTVQLGNIGPRSYHEKLQANIEAFCEKSGRDSP